MINRLIPGSRVAVETIGENVVLTGRVRTPIDATRASEIVEGFLGSGDSTWSYDTLLASDTGVPAISEPSMNGDFNKAYPRLRASWDEVASALTLVKGRGLPMTGMWPRDCLSCARGAAYSGRTEKSFGY